MPLVEVATTGTAPDRARAAAILLHGRGATAGDIIGLAREIGHADVAWVAPQAPGQQWYPYSFLAPLEQNEPHLSHSLAIVATMIDEVSKRGVPPERVALIGFSQGGCLALEYAARNARRYGCVAGLSAGLIGPPGTPRDYAGSLDGTPVFLGCSDADPHIPLERVKETMQVLGRLGAAITERIYPGMPHTINDDEIAHLRVMLDSIQAAHAT